MSSQHILYLVPDLIGAPGGIARYCRMVVQAADEAGIPLKIIALRDEKNATVTFLENFSHADYEACGGSHAMFIWKALISVLRSWPALICVGHANFSPLGWILARLCRTKFNVFIYGTDVWQTLSTLRRRTLQRADQIVAISHFTAQRAIKANYLHRNKIRILHNCLDPKLDTCAYRNDMSRADSAPSLLTVSRITLFEPLKGQEYVIQALPQLLENFPDLVYHIVGDGDRCPALQVLAERERVGHAVRFHGIVSDEALIQLYEKANVFVMPSQVEGFGFVFLEAMAQGTPAIGGNTDAAGEVIVDGETGFIVDPTSPTAIAAAIERILGDKNLRTQMSRNGIERARTKFHFRSFQSNLLLYLRELVPAL